VVLKNLSPGLRFSLIYFKKIFLYVIAVGLPLSHAKAVWKTVEFGPPPSRAVKLIDARSRDAWLKSHIPGAVSIAWDQFSQPGAASRGTPRIEPQIVADDLAHLGISPKDTIYIYGKGVYGRGNEGRLAWDLYGLGFQKIFLTDYAQAQAWWNGTLARGSQDVKPGKKWKVKKQTDLHLPLTTYRKEFGKKKYLLIAIRPQGTNIVFPGVFQNTEIKFSLSDFADDGKVVRKTIDEWIAAKGYPSTITLLPISIAGLSSAYAVLKLKSWGYNTKLIAEGYSSELK
jgi:hypothetical protein